MFDAELCVWPQCQLGDLIDDLRYGTSATCDAAPDLGVPVLRIPNVIGGKIDASELKYTTPTNDDEARYSVKKNDILLVRTNGNPAYIGRSALVRSDLGRYMFASYLIRIRCNQSVVDPEFLQAVLQSESARAYLVKSATTSAGNYNINAANLRKIRIPLPPLAEQRGIAEVLRSLDDAIDVGTAAADQAKEARTHQLETLMALPGPMRPIEDVCRLSGGFGFPIKFQGKREGAYPFAKVSDMNRPGNEVELVDAENYVDEDDLRLLKAKPFPVGTTLFPKVGAALLTNKRRIAARELIADNNVMGAVATNIDPWFLFYAFNTIDMADYVQPGAVPSVNQRTIGKIMLPVPVAEIQRAFVEAMRDFDRAIETQLAAVVGLIAAKRAVATALLSGRVRVPA